MNLGNGVCHTSVYRKPTHTGVFLNYKALAPSNWKSGLLFGAFHRAKLICSSPQLFNAEVASLRKMFIENGYPSAYFNRVLSRFQSAAALPPVIRDALNNKERNFRYIFKIPYGDPYSLASASSKSSNSVDTCLR